MLKVPLITSRLRTVASGSNGCCCRRTVPCLLWLLELASLRRASLRTARLVNMPFSHSPSVWSSWLLPSTRWTPLSHHIVRFVLPKTHESHLLCPCTGFGVVCTPMHLLLSALYILFVCLLNFLPHFLRPLLFFVFLCFLFYLFTSLLVYFLTYMSSPSRIEPFRF